MQIFEKLEIREVVVRMALVRFGWILLLGTVSVHCYLMQEYWRSQEHCSSNNNLKDCYLQTREKLRQLDNHGRTGSNLKLSAMELKAEALLLKIKKEEVRDAVDRGYSYSARPFAEVKKEIESSRIYKILKAMPKGCDLHVHDASLASFDWLIWNVTYRDDCFICYDTVKKQTLFKLSLEVPESTETCSWFSCKKKRQQSRNEIMFNEALYNNLTLAIGKSATVWTQKERWKRFQNICGTVVGLLNEIDIFREQYIRGLQEFMDDNVQCIELRAVLGNLYSTNGTVFHDPELALSIYDEITNEFVSKNKDRFFGVRIIYSSPRYKKNIQVQRSILKALAFKEKYPHLLSGFDLIGHEGSGHSLLHFLDELLLPTRLDMKLPLFLHAGETAWEDQVTEVNVIDALLLNSSRIGHGLSLTRHPLLRERLRKKGIAVEVCPISNQVLAMTSDLNEHPASVLLSEGFPMTVSSDDPAVWGAKGVSHDWYHLFMGMTLLDDGLRVLKQLAMDSIKYSSFDDHQKDQLLQMWTKLWDRFIEQLIDAYS